MTSIGGTDQAIIEVFRKCFQLSIFTLDNTLLADPTSPWHQNFQSCVIVVGILMVNFCIVYAMKVSPTPIVPAITQWEIKGEALAYIQLPLILAWCITIHKVRGCLIA